MLKAWFPAGSLRTFRYASELVEDITLQEDWVINNLH
jgi:hypothetical protein